MGAYACIRCQLDFVADEARCPKCLKKSTVREPGAEEEALADGETEPGTRTGLHLAFVGMSAAITLGLLFVGASFEAALESVRGIYPAGVGLLFGGVIAIRVAPRVAADDARPLVTYLGWLAVAGAVVLSTFAAGIVAIWMAADVSPILAGALAVILWLGGAIPVMRALERRSVRPGPETAAKKWR